MLNRLLGMIYILMKKETVTAAELAERFEVSVRTIYRDVEALSMAGIPVYTKKGKAGGICLMEQFVLDRMLVTEEEQQQILAALMSLQETGAQAENETLQKLGEFFKVDAPGWVSIDLSDWSGSRQQLFEELKNAVLNRQVIEFDYYGQYGDMSRRTVEPLQLLFKEYTWYLRAWCRERKALRLFKVLRMKRVKVTEERFLPLLAKYGSETLEQAGEPFCNGQEQNAQTDTKILLRIAASQAYRVYDRFEEEEILEVLDNGDFLIRTYCFVDDWTYGMIFSFGEWAEVLEPPHVRAEAARRLKCMAERYYIQ